MAARGFRPRAKQRLEIGLPVVDQPTVIILLRKPHRLSGDPRTRVQIAQASGADLGTTRQPLGVEVPGHDVLLVRLVRVLDSSP